MSSSQPNQRIESRETRLRRWLSVTARRARQLRRRRRQAKRGKLSPEDQRWEQTRDVFDFFYRSLQKHVKLSSHQVLMEVGVGKWGFGRFYKEKFDTVYGVDVEDYSERHPGVEFALVEKDGRIPLSDASIDLAVSHSVLEHVDDLDLTLSEINRVLKPSGLLYLTVNPLYFSGYGSHLNRNGQRLDNWEHLNPNSEHFMIRDPLPKLDTSGHDLNMLTSSMFLSGVAKQPWNIVSYVLTYEDKPIPDYVDRSRCTSLELVTKSFRFVGQKNTAPSP